MLFRLRRFRPSLLERAAPRLPAHATRVVRCYRCGKSFEASAFAESTVCPSCGGAVRLPDMVLDKGHWGGSVQTAGTVVIPEGATVRSSLIVASGDITIDGKVHAMLISGGTVRVGAKAELRGGARCRVLIVAPGAVVRGGPFEAPSDALGTVDIDAAARAVPGKGPAAWVEALEEPAPEPLVITRPVKPPLRVVR
jgi:hypothetical protein